MVRTLILETVTPSSGIYIPKIISRSLRLGAGLSYGFVSGALLEPSVAAASQHLPRNELPLIDGFLAALGIIKEGYDGILSVPPEQHPRPLEIVFETPALAQMHLQVAATVTAVKTMLAEYRELQAFAANL